MRPLILSQWRERRMVVIWHDSGALTTVRAREFWICWVRNNWEFIVDRITVIKFAVNVRGSNVGKTLIRCAETAEPIEMPFGVLIQVCPRNSVLDGSPVPPPREGHFWEDIGRLIVMYLPQTNVPVQRTQRTNTFSAARGDKNAMRPLDKLLWILV